MFNQKKEVKHPRFLPSKTSIGFLPYGDFGKDATILEVTGSSDRANNRDRRAARCKGKLRHWFSLGGDSPQPRKDTWQYK